MKHFLILVSLFFFLFSGCKKATNSRKESYSAAVSKALKLSNDKDTLKQLKALSIYEKAFTKFPDSIDDYSMYNVTYIASKFKKNDIAFKYLKPLSELVEDQEGYPGWDYILGDYSDEDYKNLKSDSRWETLKKKAEINKTLFFNKLNEDEKEFFNAKTINFKNLNAEESYNSINNSNFFLPKKKRDYSITFKINDTTKTSYFVHLPKNYLPTKSYPLLVYLHGAVRSTNLSKFETKINLKYFNRFYTKYAKKDDVILVFPKGDKNYNWMLKNDGFFMVPDIIKQLKKTLNINDNKVFVSGHSNGATGSFSYLLKQPKLFAGFSGFNTHPKIYTGGTFIQNVLNRSFINISTDQDYYYPPNANDSLNKLMLLLKADYKDYRYNGFPHWFPEFDESEPAHEIIFKDLKKRTRNPFPKNLQWEFDDNNYGTIDWISDAKLDTLIEKKLWHKPINFEIKKWLKFNKKDSLIEVSVNKKAFNFPRKSGKIIANFKNNIFNIKTSRVKSFKINISPEMVNMLKPIKIFVNAKLVFKDKIDFDRKHIIQSWKKNNDRSQLWVNFINVSIN